MDDTTTSPFHLDLQFRGYVEGLTIKSKNTGIEYCHYFGGVPYALPPVGLLRWRRPRQLPPCYKYGTASQPGRFTGKSSICPQPFQSTSLDDEDCLQCNISIPAGQAPRGGWPVYFYIHGGFLQMGTANSGDPTALIAETSFKAIVVKPAYRLNIFGFLASRELLWDATNTDKSVGNLGFWDLRLALEWTYKNVNYFGGNPCKITIGGYSAGAHAAFYQLAYDLESPSSERIIKRIVMHSNGPGPPPKSLDEVQRQFDELLHVLEIPLQCPASEKLERLRLLSHRQLLAALGKMKMHQFRAVMDGVFIRRTLFEEIRNGTFARKMIRSDVRLLIGECSDEHFVYGRYRAPANNFNSVVHRLEVDYPKKAVEVMTKLYFPTGRLTPKYQSWQEAFGKVYADMQIHVSQRGFIDALIRGGAAQLIQRYRIDWRSKLADRIYPRAWGATHGADNSIWFWGNDQKLDEVEKQIVRGAFIDLFAAFVMGEEADWGVAPGTLQVRRLRADGKVDFSSDELWEDKVQIWNALMDATLRQKASL